MSMEQDERPLRLSDGTLDRVDVIRDDDPVSMAWEAFEREVAAHLENSMGMWHLGLDESKATVRLRPSYYSKDRESEIKFDVSVEVWGSEAANRPSLLWLFECKRYPDRNVSVDEVEEFRDKMRQIGAHKGTIVTLKGFASGAITLAKTCGIALAVLDKREVSYQTYSATARRGRKIVIVLTWTLDTSGREYGDQHIFDLTTFMAMELGRPSAK